MRKRGVYTEEVTLSCERGFKNILIIGIGVMGGSFLKALQHKDSTCYVLETDLHTLSQARDEGYHFIEVSKETLVQYTIDLCICTLYPKDVLPLLQTLSPYLSSKTVCIDISGIKSPIVEQNLVSSIVQPYFSIHPMAGREHGGFSYADPCIFKNANCIVISDIRTSRISETVYADYEMMLFEFFQSLGFKKPIYLTAREHDEAITYTSQLSHILAVCLLQSEDYTEYTKDTIGDSFRDLTRIANLNITMWDTLFRENQEQVSHAIHALIDQLTFLESAITSNDSEKVQSYLMRSKKRRIEIMERKKT